MEIGDQARILVGKNAYKEGRIVRKIQNEGKDTNFGILLPGEVYPLTYWEDEVEPAE